MKQPPPLPLRRPVDRGATRHKTRGSLVSIYARKNVPRVSLVSIYARNNVPRGSLVSIYARNNVQDLTTERARLNVVRVRGMATRAGRSSGSDSPTLMLDMRRERLVERNESLSSHGIVEDACLHPLHDARQTGEKVIPFPFFECAGSRTRS
jgi:hypothetical protein